MKTFSCSGTLGDAICTVLKLYPMGDTPIGVNHYTRHTHWHPLIRDIYSLLPNVSVNFVNQRDMENPRIYSHLKMEDYPYEPFPEFDLSEVDVPDDYNCVCMRSGKPNEMRIIEHDKVPTDKPIVYVGGQRTVDSELDLGGKITIAQSFSVIRNASHFYCPQGVLCFFAMSQKVPTTVWLNNLHDVDGFHNRYAPEWEAEIIRTF